jgi:hypothetical protein
LWKRVAFNGVAMLLGLALATSAGELLVRRAGHGTWRYLGADAKEPTMNDPDPVLGWRPRPGAYVIPPYTPNSQPVRMTLLGEGQRATGPHDPHPRGSLVLVGCSITQGWAVSDHETFAWRLQQRFPSEEIRNYGVGGYGTYQSLLNLQSILAEPNPPQQVLYGFIQGHEQRNVAHPAWLQAIARFSKRGAVAVPYCTLDGGQLACKPPMRYPEWPWRGHLASVAFLEERYAMWWGGGGAAQQREVTEQLLLRMQALTAGRGVHLTVVILQAAPRALPQYVRFFRAHDIDFIDCNYPIPPELRVPGEGHPNGEMHARWARCIGDRLETVDRPTPLRPAARSGDAPAASGFYLPAPE